VGKCPTLRALELLLSRKVKQLIERFQKIHSRFRGNGWTQRKQNARLFKSATFF